LSSYFAAGGRLIDTAFMYTISILILLKIYQTRHPDINANAYTAFEF